MGFENKNKQTAATAGNFQKGAVGNNTDRKETATLCPTKAGNGFKVVVAGIWNYASRAQVLEVVQGNQKACTFHTIKDEEQ